MTKTARKYNLPRKLFLIASAIFLTIILAQREFIFAYYIDAYSYVNIATGNDPSNNEYININEPLFPLLLKAIGLLSKNDAVIYFTIQCTLLYLTLKAASTIHQRCLDHFIGLLLVMSLPAAFVLYTNLWRQLLGVLIAYAALQTNNKRHRYAFMMAAPLVHFSAAPIVFCDWLSRRQRHVSLRIRLLTAAAIIACFIVAASTASSLDLYAAYSEEGSGSTFRRIYVAALLVASLFVIKNTLRRNFLILITTLTISIPSDSLFDRASHGTIILIIISMAPLICNIKGRLISLTLLISNIAILPMSASAQLVAFAILQSTPQ
jgi:hypothetical protein